MAGLIIGNWKMNGSLPDVRHFFQYLEKQLTDSSEDANHPEIVMCPPFTLLSSAVKHISSSKIAVGAQDCSAHLNGAYTGEVSALMLKELGCSFVILGHSERRMYNNETNQHIAKKIKMALSQDMVPVLCVGETQEQKEKNLTNEVISAQLRGSLPQDIRNNDRIVIAYEPIWSIGTGLVPDPWYISSVHFFIKTELSRIYHDTFAKKIAILYGGSLNTKNSKEIFAAENVYGGLIGGASLRADEFFGIIANWI